MLLATLACLTSVVSGGQGQAVKLERVFTKGEKAKYEVHSALQIESRQYGLDTFIPEDLDLIYQYSYEVVDMKADGICVMRYLRPTMTEIEGETVSSPPKSRTDKVNLNIELTVSPTNELLNIKDLTPKKDPKKPPKALLKAMALTGKARQDALAAFVGQFVSEIYRLSLFAGSLDSSLDFNPKFPYDEVNVGDTWKRTASYAPQKSKGSNKMAVQRMDYVYTYKGVVDVNGKKFQRVSAHIELKSDLAEFIHQTYGVTSAETGLKEIPLTFSSDINFDLDPKTFKTLRASGASKGGFKIMVTPLGNEAYQEQRLSSTILMKALP